MLKFDNDLVDTFHHKFVHQQLTEVEEINARLSSGVYKS